MASKKKDRGDLDMLKNFHLSITRSTELPTHIDHAPYGSIWIVSRHKEQTYIQVSRLEKEPTWLKMEAFLGTALQDLFHDEQFIKMALGLYIQQKRKDKK